ncbi:5-dehydro-2-deoxygluconokinase [Ruminiclostridium hungatei]|uniref:5-dehydro-2-deoxygluconokinase n=1 Tax=Ruminiclostridium hungatei TaxID=48256 RepID=A0A1V4SMJ8_RUMHU|nr:carbohydrate kinase [Ruminiclostridium hungatei]OPX45112.1 5-dehydro-2-deoxygluconokinase [Ruminiclostridium hungatei]
MIDVVALGELLIDFTQIRSNDALVKRFEQNPGGAPANVLAVLSKFGIKCAFIGKVGNDVFGEFLRKQLSDLSIDCRNLVSDPKHNTTLAFVTLDDKGDRSFSFYRNHGADTCLFEKEIDLELIKACRIFHFGTLSMTHEPSLSATIKAVEYAKACGKIISFDPNYRAPLWGDADSAITAMKSGLRYADIAKLSLEEAQMVTGKTRPEDCLKELLKYELSFAAITMGPQGCAYATDKYMGAFPEYPAAVVDTTGAGDNFWGTLIFGFLSNGANFDRISEERLSEIVLTANIAAAMSTEKKGAIPSIPDFAKVRAAFEEINGK